MTYDDEYQSYLRSKLVVSNPSGFDFPADKLNPKLRPDQRQVVRWALRRGKAALFPGSYFEIAARNLDAAQGASQPSLFGNAKDENWLRNLGAQDAIKEEVMEWEEGSE